MAYSSGGRQAAGLLSVWFVLAFCGGALVVFFDEAKGFARTALGLPDPQSLEPGPRSPSDGLALPAEQPRNGRRVELAASRNGHFFAEVEVNGRAIQVMVDSGASLIALTDDDARRAGIYVSPRDYTHQVSTANGIARIAMVDLDRVAIGGILVRNVRAAVAEPGKLDTTLLGMTFLSRLSRVDMRGGRLVLEE